MLVKSMFPDSEVARQFQYSRTKTSVFARYGNRKYCHDKLIDTLRGDPPVLFSLLIVSPMIVVSKQKIWSYYSGSLTVQ